MSNVEVFGERYHVRNGNLVLPSLGIKEISDIKEIETLEGVTGLQLLSSNIRRKIFRGI